MIKYLFLFWLTTGIYHSTMGQAILKGTVNSRFGPLNSAGVQIKNSFLGTVTDVHGEFAFELDTGFYTVEFSHPGYQFQTQVVRLSYLHEVDLDVVLDEAVLDAEVTIGSKSGVSVSQLKSPVPIDVIWASDLQNSGYTELGQALHYLRPNFFSVRQDSREGTNFVNAISLRGLSPDQVLVLVNGKRTHKASYLNINDVFGQGSSGTDMNVIPIVAIERVEILRDGASSQYGSDAIAGVINIILKKETVPEFNVHLGSTTENDGFQRLVDFSYGFSLNQTGFLNVTANYLKRDYVNRSGEYNGAIFSGQSIDNPNIINQGVTDLFFSQTGFDDNRVTQIGSPEVDNAAATYNGDLPFSNEISVFSFGGVSINNTTGYGEYRFPIQREAIAGTTELTGYVPEIIGRASDHFWTAGLKGKFDDWQTEIAYSIGANALDISVFNSVNASLGQLSPISAYAGTYGNSQNVLTAEASRPYETKVGKAQISLGSEYRTETYYLNEGDVESYIDGGDTTDLGTPRTVGFQGYSGIRADETLKSSRNNTAGFIEFELEHEKYYLIEAAARYESYTDFGDNTSFKLAGRFSPFNFLSFRGSYSTGFKAPSLQQQYFRRRSISFDTNGNQRSQVNVNSQSSVANLFAATQLKPEISKSQSAGLALHPIENLSLTFDLYQIDIENRIALSATIDADPSSGIGRQLIALDIGRVEFFSNSMNTSTRGFDAIFGYNINMQNGILRFSSLYSFNRTRIDAIVFELPNFNDLPDSLLNIGQVNPNVANDIEILGRDDKTRYISYIPSQQMRNSIVLELKKIRCVLAHNYFGQVEYLHPNDELSSNWVINEFTGRVESRDQVFTFRNTLDAAFTYKPWETFECTIGGTNITNELPDKISHSGNTFNGISTYSTNAQQYDLAGAYFYSKLVIRL